MGLNLLSLLSIIDNFFSFRKDFLNLADFHIDVIFVKSSDDHFRGQFRFSDFEKRVVVLLSCFTFFTVIKVGANCTFIPNSSEMTFFTTITYNSGV
jgi:hypothetical protein